MPGVLKGARRGIVELDESTERMLGPLQFFVQLAAVFPPITWAWVIVGRSDPKQELPRPL